MASFTDWDVVIIGAGPAGCALAISLATQDWRVLVVEQSTDFAVSNGESLPPASIGLVEDYLGAISAGECDSERGLRKLHGSISCWESHSGSTTDTSFTAKGFGLSVQRHTFDAAFRCQAEKAGAELHCGTRLLSCHNNADNEAGVWILTTQCQSGYQHHRSHFVVDASGRSAVLATMLGIERYHYDKLDAFALRFISPSVADDGFTRAEACANGWWSSHCIPSLQGKDFSERYVVFFTDRDLSVAKPAAETKSWLALVDERPHFAAHLKTHAYTPVGRVAVHATGSEQLAQCCGLGWLAIGDAAQAFDPLASHGICKALESASYAAKLLRAALDLLDDDCRQQGGLASVNGVQSNLSMAKCSSKLHHPLSQFISAKRQLVNHYHAQQNAQWRTYVRQYEHYYASQLHFSDQPFWSRRIGRGADNLQQKTPTDLVF